MQVVRKRRLREVALGFFLLAHPGPVCFHIIAVTLFALLAAWPHFNAGVIALVIAAHASMQLSIAVLNDYCDRDRDAIAKRGKPIPRGLVYPQEALFLGISLIAVMILLLLPLNPLVLLISLLYLVLGQAYNLWLKATPLSGIVFALAIPLIPLYAFVGVGRVVPLIFWLVPVAALYGMALNLANSLPDLEEDAASGTRTLAVVLGLRGTLLICPLLLLLGSCVLGLQALVQFMPMRAVVLLTVVVTTLASVAIWIVGLGRSAATRRLYFYLVVVICLLLAIGWLIGVLV